MASISDVPIASILTLSHNGTVTYKYGCSDKEYHRFLVGTRGALGGVALGVAIGIVYWSLAELLQAMGGVGQLPPLVAAWSPDIIFFFLGLYFFFKMPT